MLMITDVQDIIKRHQAQIVTSLKDPDINTRIRGSYTSSKFRSPVTSIQRRKRKAVSSRGNRDIKSDKNEGSSVLHVQRDTQLHNGEFQSSSLQQAGKEEICSDSGVDS
ncbi:hypothetical protein KIW84_050035 [Lathyrus oleraceus]|uniref:Uncharacterized protein n=1 Tax=Pisum sativum TaxID=3888 RepID=A0A9D5ABV9_PEA|nr:hypothetical protein KIW84_050035 [Pisum sativum]